MIFDATTAGNAPLERSFDACVIGAGPAGITLARRLAAQGFSVALMEAGGLEYSDQSQEIYQGEVTGLDYYPLDVARLRYFGGTSNHWGGWCRELDPYDFTPHPFARLSGWPIAKSDLDPYQAEADAILDLPPPPGWADLPIEPAGRDFRHVLFRFSPPTRFADKFHDEIAASDRISLFLNANLVDLRLDSDLGGVSEAVFSTYPPELRRFPVRARVFCLCTGGLENPRLLLNFTSQRPQGVGNENGMVGRCFCEHPHFVLADLLLEKPGDEKEFYAPTEAFMNAQGVLNFGLRLEPDNRLPPLSFLRALRQSATCATSFTEKLAMRVLGRGPDCSRPGLGQYFARLTAGELLTGKVRIAAEQHLNLASRVRLGEALDVFGMRRIAARLAPAAGRHRHHADGDHRLRRLHRRGGDRPAQGARLAAGRAPAAPRHRRGRGGRLSPHVHHPDEREPLGRRGRRRLPGARALEPLYRRRERLRHHRPPEPDLHHRAAGAAPRRPSRHRGAARLRRATAPESHACDSGQVVAIAIGSRVS